MHPLRAGKNARLEDATKPGAINEAEFDAYASDYAALHESSLGRFESERGYFTSYKIADVQGELKRRGLYDATRRILDFGAGCGNSIPCFRSMLPQAALTCLDPSANSLEMASRDYPSQASFSLFDGTRIDADDQSFDVAFAACVFHHIDHDDHARHLIELRRVLRRDGLLCIFEHNPLNPMTLHVVNRCPFDENAHLLRAHVLKDRIVAAGFDRVEVRYRLFFPSFLSALRGLERYLSWLPLGAQYYVAAQKGA